MATLGARVTIGGPGVAMSRDAARMSACATSGLMGGVPGFGLDFGGGAVEVAAVEGGG